MLSVTWADGHRDFPRVELADAELRRRRAPAVVALHRRRGAPLELWVTEADLDDPDFSVLDLPLCREPSR